MSSSAISRSVEVAAPRAHVRALVSSLRSWQEWSPWSSLAADSREYSGPESGEGAFYAWSGPGKIGKGNMIVGATTPDRVEVRLAMVSPWKVNLPMRFDLTRIDGGTRVTWTISLEGRGLRGVVARLAGTDRMISRDVEDGLARLKAIAETGTSSATEADGTAGILG